MVVVALAAGCSGQSSKKQIGRGEAGAQAGEGVEPGTGGSTNAGGSSGAGGSAGTGISAGTGGCNEEADPWISVDASDCAERADGDCTGVACEFSYLQFDQAPAFTDCSRYLSFDGCGRLVFSFDANGCATGVGPPPEAWDTSEHLGDLRACMTEVFARGRFACLASQTLSFHESCFIE